MRDRIWVLVDIDRIDQPTYDRLAHTKDAFLRPCDGCFAVPVDTRLSGFAIARLMADGIPAAAMRLAET